MTTGLLKVVAWRDRGITCRTGADFSVVLRRRTMSKHHKTQGFLADSGTQPNPLFQTSVLLNAKARELNGRRRHKSSASHRSCSIQAKAEFKFPFNFAGAVMNQKSLRITVCGLLLTACFAAAASVVDVASLVNDSVQIAQRYHQRTRTSNFYQRSSTGRSMAPRGIFRR